MCASRRSTAARHDAPAPSDEQRFEAPSKSQRKRDSHALQALGVQLLDLRDDTLVRLPLSEDLVEAVRTARAIRSHEGRRRQLQLIGKLMRQADAEAIRAALADETREHRVSTAIMHAAESWRERILADDRVLANWLGEFPETRKQLEALVPRARREQSDGAPGRAFRNLFRALRERLEAQAGGNTAGREAASASGVAGTAARGRAAAENGAAENGAAENAAHRRAGTWNGPGVRDPGRFR